MLNLPMDEQFSSLHVSRTESEQVVHNFQANCYYPCGPHGCSMDQESSFNGCISSLEWLK